MQSTCDSKQNADHVAIIMDGNGRWARAQNLPRSAGHRAGIDALRRIVRAAPGHGIRTLTVFAFSADNWRRPANEVAILMQLFGEFLDAETEDLVRDGVRLSIIGRRDRLSPALVAEIERSEQATQFGDALHLRVAVDYSARAAIADAARALGPNVSEENLTATLTGEDGDVDLLIRTAGERRLSDFLLWECAYAEFVFTPRLWPDFTEADLAGALADFGARNRTFGAIPAEAA
ncbi:MAG: di-trans,poly-cis-decaprenylcistransferase [Alphaproteobacteria bacterium]|nr:di-trans,poly-cis-decaprenylcistransferase [Alphaproteobacteria bacterium]